MEGGTDTFTYTGNPSVFPCNGTILESVTPGNYTRRRLYPRAGPHLDPAATTAPAIGTATATFNGEHHYLCLHQPEGSIIIVKNTVGETTPSATAAASNNFDLTTQPPVRRYTVTRPARRRASPAWCAGTASTAP
jgi:hypothetical protein